MLRIYTCLVLLFTTFCGFSQTINNNLGTHTDSSRRKVFWWVNYHSVDTSVYKSIELSITYTLERTEGVSRKIMKMGESIFNPDSNKISKIRIEHEFASKPEDTPITLSTIPINDIIIDDSKQLILCLSRAMVSPYELVLYNFKGELLFKKAIVTFELSLDSIDFEAFKSSFPSFFTFVKRNKQIFQSDSLYYVDLIPYWPRLSRKEKDQLQHLGWIKYSHLFSPSPKCTDCTSPVGFEPIVGFYSQTDPFYEFEMKGSIPIGIILNDEYGGKVKIPVIIN